MYYAYILQCNDGTYYVGSTNDIERRVHHHNTSKAGAHYTKIRRPVSLAYKEACETYADVRRREGELKRLTRAQKTALIHASGNIAADASSL
ncbi:MAG: GIY-YIG nuclease family protein [Patescibacteria group bacterium]